MLFSKTEIGNIRLCLAVESNFIFGVSVCSKHKIFQPPVKIALYCFSIYDVLIIIVCVKILVMSISSVYLFIYDRISIPLKSTTLLLCILIFRSGRASFMCFNIISGKACISYSFIIDTCDFFANSLSNLISNVYVPDTQTDMSIVYLSLFLWICTGILMPLMSYR